MSDRTNQYRVALDNACEAEMLGSLTVDRKQREAHRERTTFHYSIAEALRPKRHCLQHKEMAD
jgi:hypothetical protein